MNIKLNQTEILNMLICYFAKHKPTYDAMLDFIKILNNLLGENVFPETKHLLLKCFSGNISATYHLECKSCNRYGFKYRLNTRTMKEFVCFRCKEKNSLKAPKVLFVTFPIKTMIEMLIKNNEDTLILHTNPPNAFPISDIFNGKIYREAVEKHGAILALGTNTDGVARFKCTSDSLWPQYFVLYNLPKDVRMKEENIAVSALFSGKTLEMEYFYETFVDEIKEINSTGGIQTKFGKLPVFCITASLDSTARPKLQNHTQFNGFFGCSFCYAKGESMSSMKYPSR